MLAIYIKAIPLQLRIALLFEPNLIKELRHGAFDIYNVVNGGKEVSGGKIIRLLRNSIHKLVCGSLHILNGIPEKKISKIFSQVVLVRGEIRLCKKVCRGTKVCIYYKLISMKIW